MKKLSSNIIFIFFIGCFSIFLFTGCSNGSCTIASAEGFIINNSTLTCAVASNTSSISLYDKIKVSSDCSWELCYDLEGTSIIQSKTVSLNTGDNIFYILVKSKNNGDVKVYTVCIRRKVVCVVSFNTDNNSNIPSQYIDEGGLAQQPVDPQKTGCTFTGWDRSFSQPISANTTFTALWSKNTYVIEFDSNGGSYVNSIVGLYGSEISEPSYPQKTDFIFAGWFMDKATMVNEFDDFTSMPGENLKLYAKWLRPNIYTKNDLIAISNCKSTWCQTLSLCANIDLNNCEWSPIGNLKIPFTGVFNGNGYTISNCLISKPTASHVAEGLFGCIENATIERLNISNISISHSVMCNSYVGGLAGYATNCNVRRCSVIGNINLTGQALMSYTDVGGIVGYFNSGELSNCYSNGNTFLNGSKKHYYVGGLVGMAEHLNAFNCYSTNNIYSGGFDISYAGGLMGALKDSTIRSCIFMGTVSCTSNDTIMAVISGFELSNTRQNCLFSDDVKFYRGSNETAIGWDNNTTKRENLETIWSYIYYNWSSTYWNKYLDANPTLK